MAERFKAHAWKVCVPSQVPWVRIPLSPPKIRSKKANENLLIHQLNSRINIKFKISRFLKGKPPYKFFLKPIEKKNV